MQIIICLIIGYVFGCISTGYIVGKLNHVDIRKYGSGNAGTTNALRTLGIKAGAVTFLGDALKAVLPMLLVPMAVLYFFPAPQEAIIFIPVLPLYVGLGVVLGHNFPVWLKFKGGKGIAATAGVMLAFDWRFGLAACLIFIIVVAITRYVSLGSLIMSLVFPIAMVMCYPGNIHMLVLSIIFVLLAFIKHHANIGRLLHGTENKLGKKVNIEK